MTAAVEFIRTFSTWVYALCLIGLLICLKVILDSRRERGLALFTLEREAANEKAYRALVGVVALLMVSGLVAANNLLLAPVVENIPTEEPTLPPLLLNTPAPLSPTATLTPTATPTPRPARSPTSVLATETPSPTPTRTVVVVAAQCPNPQVRITSPMMGTRVTGSVQILGTAAIPDFQFYKVEYAPGESPKSEDMHSISDPHRSPVTEGLLEIWNVSGLPPGTYTLRLTVVDITGNFPPPCDVRVVVEGR